MTREDVVNFYKLYYFNKFDTYSIMYFLWQYCVYRGKDPKQSKLFVSSALEFGVPILQYAIDWCDKEFSINKLYSAPNPKGERELIQIF